MISPQARVATAAIENPIARLKEAVAGVGEEGEEDEVVEEVVGVLVRTQVVVEGEEEVGEEGGEVEKEIISEINKRRWGGAATT